MRRRRSERERELEKLDAQIGAAEEALELARAEVEAAVAAEAELSSVGADVVLGVADAAVYQRQENEVAVRLAEARKAARRSEGVFTELRRRAVALVEDLADAKTADAEKMLAAAEERVAGTREQLALCERERDSASNALDAARRDREFAAARYDPTVAERAAQRERQEAEVVDWHAANPALDSTVPLLLRDAVMRKREELLEQAEETKRRMREEAEQSWREAPAPVVADRQDPDADWIHRVEL